MDFLNKLEEIHFEIDKEMENEYKKGFSHGFHVLMSQLEKPDRERK